MTSETPLRRPWPRFVLDGESVEARDVAPTTTLLQYLRETLGRHDTKEGCAEGDCGACTVVLGEPCDGAIRYRAVNACIQFVGTVDGKEVVTAGSLRDVDGSLHPVQRAMVECHASQCGFCTPGFVMSLFARYVQDGLHSRDDALDAISGNLCRCTGYRPIVDAALHACELPAPQRWSRADAQSAARRARLAEVAPARATPLSMASGAGFEAPQTLAELADLYANDPDALLLAGGTDVGLWVTKLLRDLPRIVYIGAVQDLQSIDVTDGALTIGAGVDLTRAFDAILAHYPTLAEIANRFGSVPIRNAGTLVGNIANGSPIGDSMPALIALRASVMLRHGRQERTLPLEELYLGYQKKALRPGELVAAVRIPLPEPSTIVASYKIAKRFDQDISAVCGAYALRMRGDVIASARIAYGGMAATPRRAPHAEAALTGKPWREETFAAAASALAHDFSPIDDMRASALYRSTVAANLLRRLHLEHGPNAPEFPVGVFQPLTA
jgi:xanthine dehydrogenase small subunit